MESLLRCPFSKGISIVNGCWWDFNKVTGIARGKSRNIDLSIAESSDAHGVAKRSGNAVRCRQPSCHDFVTGNEASKLVLKIPLTSISGIIIV